MPVLRVIKRAWPDAQVFWWIEASLAPLFESDPDLDGTFVFRRKGWRTIAWWREVWRTLSAVRKHRFDYVLDLQGLSRSAFFAWLANGRTVIGLDNDREGRREAAQIFYDVLARPSPRGTPAANRYLGVLERLGLPIDWNFQWLPRRRAVARKVNEFATQWPSLETVDKVQGRARSPLRAVADDPADGGSRQVGTHPADDSNRRFSKWVVLLPGARWMNKRWPAELFAQTTTRLATVNPDLRFAILGVAGDKPLAEVICRANPNRCLDLTGQTSLPEMIEWLRLAELVISNDTGPLHVAAALRRPLLAIYGPSDPNGTGPHGQSAGVLQASHLPCVPCMKQTCDYVEPLACMKSITPEMVANRALAVLGKEGSSSSEAGTSKRE